MLFVIKVGRGLYKARKRGYNCTLSNHLLECPSDLPGLVFSPFLHVFHLLVSIHTFSRPCHVLWDLCCYHPGLIDIPERWLLTWGVEGRKHKPDLSSCLSLERGGTAVDCEGAPAECMGEIEPRCPVTEEYLLLRKESALTLAQEGLVMAPLEHVV